MTRIMMATVPHVTSGLGLRKFQANGFLLTRVYNRSNPIIPSTTRQCVNFCWLHAILVPFDLLYCH